MTTPIVPTLVGDFVQGDNTLWKIDAPAYPATDGWTLTLSLRGPSVLDLTASALGTSYQLAATAAQTAALTAGSYYWQAVVALAGQRFTVERGQLTVKADLSLAVAGYDGRTPAAIALAQAEAALATFKSTAGRVKSYTIGDRTMVYNDASELVAIISYWRRQVMNETTADRIADGLGNPRKMFVRFQG